MSIASEITRLQGVKSDILTAIADKGVTVPADSALDDCPGLIGDIPTGGGGTDGYEGSLPSDYVEVQYLEQTSSDGGVKCIYGSYFAGSENSVVTVELKGTKSSGSGILVLLTDGFGSSPTRRIDIDDNSSTLNLKFVHGQGGSEILNTGISQPLASTVIATMTGGGLCYSKSSGTAAGGVFHATYQTTTRGIVVFRWAGLMGSNALAKVGKVRMYSYDYSKVFMNLVPCRKSDNSAIGYYDLVGNTFFPKEGTVAAGPDVA